MEIRKASIKDKEAIEKLSHEHSFEINRKWEKILSSQKTETYILIDNDKIVGLTGLIHHKWNNTLQILNIFIHPDYRRQGLGLKLINHIKGIARQSDFRCLIAEAPSNTNAPKLYEKAGFRKSGYNDRYYSNSGEPVAYWMSYDLK